MLAALANLDAGLASVPAAQHAETYYIFYYSGLFAKLMSVSKLLSRLEAAIGIEPMNKGFADLCLTTWLRRHL